MLMRKIILATNKDPGKQHFVLSIIKSTVRILGCILAMLFQSITVFATFFILAELIGIWEEL